MIVIVDFGSQYNQLIARKVRSLNVAAQIVNCNASAEEVVALKPAGLILSGGPASVHVEDAPKLNRDLLELGVPVLGICYGMQALAQAAAGQVQPGEAGEYGRTALKVLGEDPLFHDVSRETVVWMSHRDSVVDLPGDWKPLASSANCKFAATRHADNPWWGVQFHPEVHHTDAGEKMLENFAIEICNATRDWQMGDWIEDHIASLRTDTGDRNVVAAVSGGVDSTVMAVLLHRALGDRLRCLFIDNGLLRMNESEQVMENFAKLGVPVERLDEAGRFLDALAGESDPEGKRRIIGRVFIEVLREHIGDSDLLAQGTLYPDVIESISTHGPSATIKTHHNRVAEVLGLMKENRIIEPLRELFKDEVREVGAQLGIPRDQLWRHPFPGPGLAVRILGDITEERLDLVRRADRIVVEELHSDDLYYDQSWQAFAVLLPVRSTGVMGDERTYGQVIAIRAVTSTDGMTADWARLPYDTLAKMANRIINEIAGINRVVYDISSKPPSTIEWE